MPDQEHERAVRTRVARPFAKAEERRVIEMLRQARGSVAGVETSLAAMRRRVRQLEDENERLRHGPQGGAA